MCEKTSVLRLLHSAFLHKSLGTPVQLRIVSLFADMSFLCQYEPQA